MNCLIDGVVRIHQGTLELFEGLCTAMRPLHRRDAALQRRDAEPIWRNHRTNDVIPFFHRTLVVRPHNIPQI